MYRNRMEPSPAHYNLVIRTLKVEGYVDKMFKMVMAISHKEGARINANTFELVIEAVLEKEQWREALLLIQSMERLDFQPSLEIYVSLVELLERARQYKAVLAIYKHMVNNGYDFYDNIVLNGVFKRLVSVAAKGIDADLKSSAASILSYVNLPNSLQQQQLSSFFARSGSLSGSIASRSNSNNKNRNTVVGGVKSITPSITNKPIATTINVTGGDSVEVTANEKVEINMIDKENSAVNKISTSTTNISGGNMNVVADTLKINEDKKKSTILNSTVTNEAVIDDLTALVKNIS